MSVVPLVENDSFVTSQERFAEGGGVLGARVLIRHFDETQLRGPGANVSYDLRVGPRYRDHREEYPRDLQASEEIVLLPGSAVVVQSEEEVHFPRTRFGYVLPKVGILQQGLSNTISKVDPGYSGPLVVTLFNLGRQKVKIKRSQPFCALVIHQVADGATLYNGAGKQVAGQRKAGITMRFRELADGLDAHRTVLLIVVGLVTLLQAGWRVVYFFWHLHPKK